SVECGKNDKVIVDFGSYPDRDSVIFKDKYGVKLKVVDGNILSFTGVSKADTNYIYAYRGDKKIGKLFLNTYQRKIYNVVLVSVNEAKILHEKNVEKAVKKVEESLNKVYNQCAVSFKISHTTISINDLTSFSHGGSGILTVYNDDQKKVLSAYEKEKKMTDGVFYLFFIDNVTDKKDGSGTPVSGYMPRGYNAGFIYDGGSPHTIAHELGHGIAGLEHVFENSNASGKTANLMDYASGEELWHFQWDQIQDPSRVWMKWNKDESEGESLEGIEIYEFPNEDCKIVYYLFSAYNSQVLRDHLKNGNKKEAVNCLYIWTKTKFIQSDYATNLYNGLADNIDDEAYNNNLSLFKSRFKECDFVGMPFENSKGTRNAIAVYYIWGFTNAGSLEELRNHEYAVIYEPYYIDRLVIPFDDNQNYEIVEHQETVLRWIQKNVGVVQGEIAVSAQGGFVSAFSGQATAKFGLAFDAFGNVALYGDQSAFYYWVGHGFHTESLRENPARSLFDFKYGGNEPVIFDASLGGNLNLFWQFRMSNVKDVFGIGAATTVSFTLYKVTVGGYLSWDSNGKFMGIGAGAGKSLSIPFSFSHLKSANRGLIVTWEEFLNFVSGIKNVSSNQPKDNIGLKIEDDPDGTKRLFIVGPKTIDTGIEIEPNDAPKTNPNNQFYYISKAANEIYKDLDKKTK
ncbi:MAG: hypothetical protein PUC50_09555, partial [Bacteroidales bacterium]|nr:hypothetical protein [Bacteroidales bacterium]